ncbi:MAG: hypothetical protein NTV62_03665 [Candidatus Gribaldobacteria bacterium]|nr:hypothetical protein [Candidatus Gribaldobacteria bacterium]
MSLSLDLKEGMMVGDLFSLAFAVDKSIRFKKVFWFDFLHLHDSNGFITEVGVLNGEIVIRPEFINRIIRKKLEGV